MQILRAAMKNYKTSFSVLRLSLFALALAFLVPVPPAYAGPDEATGAVSVVDAPPPAATDNYPPQPVSVAPAEEGGSMPVAATPSETTTAPVAITAAPDQPSAAGLTPLPSGDEGTITGTNVMGDSGAQQKHSGTYYDSTALVPNSDLARSGAVGPRKVDPAYEPGQKYIIVDKGAGASSFEGQYVAATRALKLGRYAAAMEMFEKLYKKNHKDSRVLMGLAVAQQGAGFTESAARTYEDVLKVQPNNADAIVNLMGIMRMQYPSVTLKKLMELRDKYPSNPGIPAQIGLVSAELENYDDAIRYFEVASSMDPRNSSHVFNMAIAADKKGDAGNAIKYYEKALQLDATYGDVANSIPRKEIYDRLVVLRRKVS